MAYRYKLAEWEKPSDFTFDSCYNIADRKEASDRRNRYLLVNLIDLLVGKGLITEAEVINDLFEDGQNYEVAPATENEARTAAV